MPQHTRRVSPHQESHFSKFRVAFVALVALMRASMRAERHRIKSQVCLIRNKFLKSMCGAPGGLDACQHACRAPPHALQPVLRAGRAMHVLARAAQQRLGAHLLRLPLLRLLLLQWLRVRVGPLAW